MSDRRKDIILSIYGMSKPFDRNRVLDHIDSGLRRGSVMDLMGESGTEKSMMMRRFFGTYQKDEGETIFDGHEVSFSGPKGALENGITMVHRELNQYLERSVVDDLFLGHYPVNGADIVDEAHMKKEVAEFFRSLSMIVNLTQPMWNMSVSQRQVCEIAKAVSYHSEIIVLDEPTSSLTEPGARKLFTMVQKLRDQGILLIYISYKMDEVFEICDQVSVLRGGKLVIAKDTSKMDLDKLIAAMVGHSLENRFLPVDNTPSNDIFPTQYLPTKFESHIQDVTFNMREGEIFGLYGLVGVGRTKLLEIIFGIRIRAAGRTYHDDRLMNFNSAKETMEHGSALITEEGKANGPFFKGNLVFNTAIANLRHYENGPALSDQKMVKATSEQLATIRTRCMGPEGLISSLSGGNQQKVIFDKWLERGPNVFMMNEPTRGTDVGVKYEVYELIIRTAKEGKTVIVVSLEMPEILGIMNRIGVMSNGYPSGIVETKETNQEELLCLSVKYL